MEAGTCISRDLKCKTIIILWWDCLCILHQVHDQTTQSLWASYCDSWTATTKSTGKLPGGLIWLSSVPLLIGYCDSDYANDPDTEWHHSVAGYCFSLGSGMASWSTKKEKTVADLKPLTCAAEYMAAFEAGWESLAMDTTSGTQIWTTTHYSPPLQHLSCHAFVQWPGFSQSGETSWCEIKCEIPLDVRVPWKWRASSWSHFHVWQCSRCSDQGSSWTAICHYTRMPRCSSLRYFNIWSPQSCRRRSNWGIQFASQTYNLYVMSTPSCHLPHDIHSNKILVSAKRGSVRAQW